VRPHPLLLALLLASSVAGAPCLAAEGDPPPAPADPPPVSKDPVGDARKLRDEGKELFKAAGDTDLPRDERKRLRQESMKKLKEARRLLDYWLELHPEQEDALTELTSDIAGTMYWLRKEGGVGEFDPAGSKPKPPEPPPEAPAGPAPEKPPPPPSPAEELAKIADYEKAHPGDVPGLHERYSKFLTDFPDRTTPEYATAVQRVDDLGRRLKEVYQKARDDDPDALADMNPGDAERLVDQLTPDLKAADPAVRERAAKFLGGLGSGKAAQALTDAVLSEKEEGPLDAMKSALARIGGRRVCQRLAKEKPEGPSSDTVVDILLRMVKLGGVNARISGETLFPFVKPRDEATRGKVAADLFAAGRDGAVGLSLLVDYVPVEAKVGYIEFLGKAGEPRVAGNLARFLTVNPLGARRRQHQAALEALDAIGKPGVRYLIPALDDPTCQVWTAEVLRKLTGAKPKDDKRKTWEKWFRENRKAVEGK
jgi:hypothetical protein